MDNMSRTKSPLKTAYDRFMESEGIPVVEGWYVADVRETERSPWKRLGGKGAFIQLYGLEVSRLCTWWRFPRATPLRPSVTCTRKSITFSPDQVLLK